MAKKNLNYTIIIPEQMPKVAEGVEQQWRVVERTMCSRRDGRNPAGQNPHEWESIAEVKAVLGEGFPSKREAHSFIKKIPEPEDAYLHTNHRGVVFRIPRPKQQIAALG